VRWLSLADRERAYVAEVLNWNELDDHAKREGATERTARCRPCSPQTLMYGARCCASMATLLATLISSSPAEGAGSVSYRCTAAQCGGIAPPPRRFGTCAAQHLDRLRLPQNPDAVNHDYADRENPERPPGMGAADIEQRHDRAD
jgi:hypothetical protein